MVLVPFCFCRGESGAGSARFVPAYRRDETDGLAGRSSAQNGDLVRLGHRGNPLASCHSGMACRDDELTSPASSHSIRCDNGVQGKGGACFRWHQLRGSMRWRLQIHHAVGRARGGSAAAISRKELVSGVAHGGVFALFGVAHAGRLRPAVDFDLDLHAGVGQYGGDHHCGRATVPSISQNRPAVGKARGIGST